MFFQGSSPRNGPSCQSFHHISRLCLPAWKTDAKYQSFLLLVVYSVAFLAFCRIVPSGKHEPSAVTRSCRLPACTVHAHRRHAREHVLRMSLPAFTFDSYPDLLRPVQCTTASPAQFRRVKVEVQLVAAD
jgi:hypothetical protein